MYCTRVDFYGKKASQCCHFKVKFTTDVRQPWTKPQDCYFEYLIIRFDYLIIRFDYLTIG